MSRLCYLAHKIEEYSRHIDVIAKHLDDKIERGEEYDDLDKAMDAAFDLLISHERQIVDVYREAFYAKEEQEKREEAK